MLDRFEKERNDAIAADKTGYGFIRDMFYYELANHEYCVTGELDETLDALGITYEQLSADREILRIMPQSKKIAVIVRELNARHINRSPQQMIDLLIEKIRVSTTA